MVGFSDALKTKSLFDADTYERLYPDATDYEGGSYEHYKQVGMPAGVDFPSLAPEQVNDSVTDRVVELTKYDSPLRQMARTEGKALANQRGMLNASSGVQAAEDAVMRWATPIASQEATQAFQANQGSRAFEYTMVQTDIENEQRALDRDLQATLARWNIEASDRQAAAQMATNMQSIYMTAFSNILANPNMGAADRSRYLEAARSRYDTGLDLLQQIYDVDLTWDLESVTASGGSSGGGTYPQTPYGGSSGGVPRGLDFNTWAYTVGADRFDPASMTRYQQYLAGQ